MAFCHLQEKLEINMLKKLMNTATKVNIVLGTSKYGKKIIDATKKARK